MGKIISLSVFLFLAFLWDPAVCEEKCSIACKGSPSGQTFLSGHKYNYGVESIITVYLTEAENQETSIKVLGQVSVTALGNCVHVLDVQSLVISGPDGTKYQSPPGMQKPVKFGYQDGKIFPEICAADGDSRRSLNIKRAIISLLQNEQKPSTQVDVFGVCPTEVSSSQEGGSVLVHRSRDLSLCSHREQGKSDLIISNINPDAGIKDLQVLQSTLNVESKLSNGIPEKVSATEEYLYRPFSVGQNGARAKVHTKLTATGKAAGGAAGANCVVARPVIFENAHGESTAPNNAQTTLSALKDAAKAMTTEANSKSAAAFAQLVRIMRRTEKEDLMKVFNQAKGNDLEKRVFLDAILRAGTGDSIEASINILKSRQLSQIEQQLVFLSLGNAKHVNNDALKAAAGLLDLSSLPKDVYLGAGALAGAYCREHECHRAKSDGIVMISQKFANKLHGCKAKTKAEEDTIVAVLKGIRNIRHLEDVLVDKLVHCAVDNNVRPRVRAAALEAFHADPCSAKIKKTSVDLMKNRQLDSEIRIKAYLAVIECPCGHTANEIKNLLDTEPVHQVGSFITSSLRHIRSSANPDKQLARQHYGLIRTPNKFNVDDRKYSFYRETSFNVDALGAGGSVDQTVIYSQDSFLPRSVNFNLTVEMFGHNYNVFEFGGRQGNLDRVAEHFLGPKSFLRTESPQSIYDGLIKRFNEAKKKMEDSLMRGRRSIKSDIDNFDKVLKAESTPYNNELDLDLYVKLFGTDAVFLSFGDDKGFDFNKILDQIIGTCSNGINKMKHFQTEFRTNLLFIDADLFYPTSIGIPLQLSLSGSATARLDVATNIDVRQILQSPQNAKVDIKFIPSSDIEIAGALLIQADAVTTGLKVMSNLHSSTGVHVIAKVLENGHGFDLQLGLPIDKQEIVQGSNELVYVTAEKGQKEKITPIKIGPGNKDYSACFDQLSGVLGLTLCSEASVPFAFSKDNKNANEASISQYFSHYPLSGSAKFKLVLEKNDLRGYHIKGVVKEDKSSGRRSFELLFDAEGSQNRRTQLTGETVYNDHEVGFQIGLDSPIKKLFAQFSAVRKPSEMTALIKGKIDSSEYYGRIGFIIQGNDQRSVYKPILEYQLAEDGGKRHDIKVDGQVIREYDGRATKYTFEGISIKLPNTDQPLEITGHVTNQNQPSELDFNVAVKNYATFKGCLKGTKDVTLEFDNKLNPNINFKLKGIFEFGDSLHNEIDIHYGPNLNDPNSRISFLQSLKYHVKSVEDFNIITKNNFEIRAIPFKIVADADVDPKKVIVQFGGKFDVKVFNIDVEARTQIKKPGDYSVKVKTDFDKMCIEVFAKRDIVNSDKSNLENYIDVKDVGRYELSGVLLHKTKVNDMNVGAIGHLKISAGGKNEDIKFDIGVIENARLYSSHATVSGSKGNVLDYLLKFNRGANANGQLKFILKNAIAANGQFKVNENDGKGNGMVIVDFKALQRKIKADVKFETKEPIFNVDVDVYLNLDKDNKEKICLSTKTKKTDKFFESNNKLEYGGKQSELNIKQDGVIAVTGKTHAVVELVLPNERCINFKVDRDITHNDGLYNGHVDALISDSPKRGSAGSTISYKAKIQNSNFEKEIMNYDGQLEFHLKDGKQLRNVFTLKNIPEGDKFKFDFKTDFSGNLIPKPASLSASGTYTDSDTLIDDKYRVKGNYGDDFGFEMTGAQDIKFLEKGDKKYSDENSLTVRLPFDQAHDIRIVSNILFLLPEGQEVAEYTLVESVQVNADVYKFDTTGKVGLKDGHGAVKIMMPHVDPFIFDFTYKNGESGDKQNNFVEIKSKYGKGKSAFVSVDSSYSSRDSTLKVKAHAPQADKLKKLEFTIVSKNPAPDTYSGSVIVDADGRIYKSDSSIVLSKAHPVLDLQYSSPSSNKLRKIYIKGTSLSSTQGKIELKLDNVNDICLDAVSEASIQKDDMAIKVHANSKELKLINYNMEISSKDTGNGKRLEFRSVNDNKNVFTGSTSFISKQEGPKTIIEGSGTIKVLEEQKSANFKYIRTVLSDGNEKGVETFLNVAVGEKSYVTESRVTNLEYKNSYVYCEEKKQCAHAEIQSKVNLQPGKIENIIIAGFDLTKLGVSPEVGIELREEVSENKLPQFTMDLHVNTKEKKYYIHAYNTPENGRFASGVTFTLPTRVMALESTLTYPTNKDLPFPIKGEASIDLNKNKPGHKTGTRFLVDFSGFHDKQETILAEIGFFHPRIEKEAVIKFKGAFIHPGNNQFKFETSATICHSALGADREAKIVVEVSPKILRILATTPFVKVIDIDGTFESNKNIEKARFKFCLLEGKPVVVSALVKDFQYYEFTTGYLEESDRKLSVIAHLIPEKRVDITADIILSGQKKNIAYGALFLKDNLVKSDYGISKDNFNYFLNALKKDLDTLSDRLEQLGKDATKEFNAISQRAAPYFKKIDENFRMEWSKFYKEICEDKVLKDISQFLEEIIHYVAKIIDDVVQGTGPIVDSFTKSYVETSKKFEEALKKLDPEIEKLYNAFATILKVYFDGVIDALAYFTALITDFFEKHKAELQELTNVVTDIFKDLTRITVVQLKAIPAQVIAAYNEVIEAIKNFPLFNVLKDKWNEMAIPEQVLNALEVIYSNIEKLLPTQETKDLAEAIHKYVQKKLRDQKADDSKELRVIYQKLITALTSVLQFVRTQLGEFGVVDTPVGFSNLLFAPSIASAPTLAGDATWSFVKQVLAGEFPDLVALVKAYRPRSINPLDEIPSKLRAVIINGQHIFTFDGRHLTFPGQCRYVLAHDHADRNFTLLMQLQNGQPKALILEDKSGAIIELKDNGQAYLNGASHGFPIIEEDVFAFRQPNGRIGVGSKYGLMAFCTSKLEVCYFEVNGFYLGKLRGLLGDGNNEQYDDFRLPNGKICTSESEFGNAYRLARSCPQVQAPEHSHHQLHQAPLPAACEKVFGGISPLKPVSLFLDISPFRQACIHACSTNDPEKDLHEACDLARGYAALALTGMLPAALPDVCVRCTDADKPREIGDTYELKLPSKQADIIVSIETTEDNEKNYKDIVVPLVAQIVDSLKSKRCTDIKVYLVGHTSKYPYPILYDTDLKLKNAKVHFDDKDRYDRIPKVKTGYENFDKYQDQIIDIIETLKIKSGLINIEFSKNSLFDLPLRAGAVKHVVFAVGQPCIEEFYLLEALGAVVYDVLLENMAATTSLVTVTPTLKIGSGKNAAQVVGFSDNSVLMLGDKKAKDSEALRATLENAEDACINFVEATGGYVFSATNYHRLNGAQQKQYLQGAANVIAQKMLSTQIVQECTCSYVDPFRVRSVCYNKDRKDISRRRK